MHSNITVGNSWLRCLFFSAFLFISLVGAAQNYSNILLTNTSAEEVLLGNYAPVDYAQSDPINGVDEILCAMQDDISADSLHSYIAKLETFYNRNTYSDTVSNTRGIGAARRWVYGLFQQFNVEREGRLLPAYLQFDLDSLSGCSAGRFKNILAVLPGADTSDKSIVIVEGHMDSRCDDACDITCFASGADDNSSGTALVIELARVMSQYTFDHTIVFMVTVGEEQGLLGAGAMAEYAVNNAIPIKAVQNNDVVGGVLCGMTSSPPSCSPVASIDSTQVRIFSFGNNLSPHKNYARFVKMVYEEKILPDASVPMTISVMTPEDRTGRGGDHIPFRQRGFTAVRFSSSHEHGDGNPSQPFYMDHQHTSGDSLGVDFDNDGEIDSFFVDFNYLKRNTIINAAALAVAASGPDAPDFTIDNNSNFVRLEITQGTQYPQYRIAVRSSLTDFDAIYDLKDTLAFDIPDLIKGTPYKVSVAAVNDKGVTSLFSEEQFVNSDATTTGLPYDTVAYFPIGCRSTGIDPVVDILSGYDLSQNYPNPFHGSTFVTVSSPVTVEQARIILHDIQGRQVSVYKIDLHHGVSHIEIPGADMGRGLYLYSLEVAGELMMTRKMIHY